LDIWIWQQWNFFRFSKKQFYIYLKFWTYSKFSLIIFETDLYPYGSNCKVKAPEKKLHEKTPRKVSRESSKKKFEEKVAVAIVGLGQTARLQEQSRLTRLPSNFSIQ